MTAANAPRTPEEARAELAAALNAIEDKLNVPKRVSAATENAAESMRRTARRKPVPFALGATATAAAVGGIVFAIVRKLVR